MNNDQIAFNLENIKNALEISIDAVIIVNQAGIIVLANGQAAYLFGYDLSELVGMNLEALLPEKFRTSHPHKRRRYFSEAHTRPMGEGLHLFGRKADGSEFPIDVGLRPIMIDSILHAFAVIRDKTEIIAVQAVFEQRLASFTAVSSEKLQEMIEKYFGDRVAIIEVAIPKLEIRVEEVEKSMKEIGDQWKEVYPTLKSIVDLKKQAKTGFFWLATLIAGTIVTTIVTHFLGK